MEQISASWEFILNLLQNHSIEVFGKWRHFQIRLLLWEMQVVRYFLCVRHTGEKSLNRLLDCYCSLSWKQPPEAFRKKVALKNFANFTGKHLCWSLFLIKLQAQGPFLKRDSNTGVFQSNFRNSFEKSICEPLLLYLHL